MRTTYIQSNLAYSFNSTVVAHFYNEFIYGVLGGLVFLNVLRHFFLPRIRHLMPKTYFKLETFFIKHLYMTSTLGGKKSSQPVSPTDVSIVGRVQFAQR